MCYSNCKNENFNGECTTSKRDIYCHCFEGFVCENCGEIFESDIDLSSDIENVCVECSKLVQE